MLKKYRSQNTDETYNIKLEYSNLYLWDKVICYALYDKYIMSVRTYRQQKKFLDEYPEKFKELEEMVKIKPKIRKEFDHLWSASDMGLL